LPIDTLKIDHSFVKELTAAADSGEIVRTIVALAHGLGIDVVAEGVERPDQLQVLRELGCEFAQGFLLSHPVEDTRMAPALDRADWLPAL
jgi:EAL domain-containing protein (putative c-di-GMP-specific phosphodiesterase class I)